MGNKSSRKSKARKNIPAPVSEAPAYNYPNYSPNRPNVKNEPEKSTPTFAVNKLYPSLSETNVQMETEKTLHEFFKDVQPVQSQNTKPTRRASTQSLKPLGTVYKFGDRKSGLKANFEGPPQDFEKLKEQHLKTGKLFEDPVFPATDASFYLHGRGEKRFKWLRPSEIVNRSVFISDGAERFDVCQGELGNCWVLAAIANLTLHKGHLERVVPPDQTFSKGKYAGIFHFRFWQYGKWIEVVVDDRLPTENGKLVLIHSTTNHEFWSALLEKAYAKLHGSYESLDGGYTCEAMEDFTGGLSESYELQSNKCPGDLFTVMMKAYQRGSLMGCSIHSDDENELRKLGLITSHAYSVTAVKVVQTNRGKVRLLRVRNPWGNETEWKGAWNDTSSKWAIVSESERRALGYTVKDDGEFWISFKDFKKYFTSFEITNLTPDSLEEDVQRKWDVHFFEGQWIPGVSSGGTWLSNPETYSLNPQYMITLVDHDEDDDDDLCTVVVAVMQKDRQIKRKMGLKELQIGFSIYKMNEGSQRGRKSGSQVLSTNFFQSNEPVAEAAPAYQREVIGRFRLKPGRYCIVPSTSKSNQKGEFMIRFFTEKVAKRVLENDDEVSLVAPKKNAKKKEPKTPTERSDAEKKAIKFFQDVAGADFKVNEFELQKIINQVFERELELEEFSIEACRSMVAMMDFDESRKLGFNEFIQLWRDLKSWCAVFQKHDHDDSKTISAGELKEAFHDVGINVSRQILRMLVNRFGHTSKDTSTFEDQLYFDDFICCSLKMKRCIEVWNNKKTKCIPSAFTSGNTLEGSSLPSVSSFTLDEFMKNVLYT